LEGVYRVSVSSRKEKKGGKAIIARNTDDENLKKERKVSRKTSRGVSSGEEKSPQRTFRKNTTKSGQRVQKACNKGKNSLPLLAQKKEGAVVPRGLGKKPKNSNQPRGKTG